MLSTIILSLEKEKAKKWLKDFDKNSHINTYMFDDDGENLIIHVQGNLDISKNKFEKLPYKFGSIDGSFNISECGLLTLQNGPTEVSKDFIASHNQFKSLVGCPEYIGQNFDIQYCDNLSSFSQGPEVVIGHYLSTSNNNLRLINKLFTKIGRFSHITTEKKQFLLGLEKEYLNTGTHFVFQCTGNKLAEYVEKAIKNNPNILTIVEGTFGMQGRQFN